MADNICPICQRPNDANAERCWYCQAELTQNQNPTPVNGTDWLNGLREESIQSSEPETTEPNPETEKPEEVPDWLARIRTREQLEREAQANQDSTVEPEPTSKDKKDELPDWLKEIKAGYSGKKSDSFQEEAEQASISPFAPSTSEDFNPLPSRQDQGDDTDEWLSRLAAWKPVEEENKILSDEQSTVESVIGDSEQTKPPSENLPEAQFDLDSLAALHQAEFRPFELNRGNDWQNLEIDELKVEPQAALKDEQQLSFEDLNSAGEVLPPSNFDFNALRETISAQQSNPDFFAEKNPLDEDLEKEDLQDFDLPTADKTDTFSDNNLIFSDEQSESGLDNSNSPPFMPDDLPDWLATAKLDASIKSSGEVEPEEMGAGESEAELEKVDLPSWLQSARNADTESSKPDSIHHTDADEEGLFAGISGTLKTPRFNIDIRKPTGYGTALKVSERQKISANLFASMVVETYDDEDVEIPKKSKNQRIIWRFALAVALIGIILLSKSILAPFVIQPELFPPEVVSLYDQVNAISLDKPVLLAGDFEAAVTGELSWSSQSLLENLMRRNLQLVVLSSTPSGSTLMTQLIKSAAKNVEGYDMSTHVITLGYLPGGPTGVQLLAGNPRAAMPYTHDLDAAWNSEILHNVNMLSDFGALIILSDKSESSRAWVEQVQPGLGKTPLMFVISAQAAPLLQPYYQSGQISGFIAGFYGSLAYKQMYQQTTDVDVHLSGFQSTMLLVVVFILISGLITLIRPAVPERKG